MFKFAAFPVDFQRAATKEFQATGKVNASIQPSIDKKIFAVYPSKKPAQQSKSDYLDLIYQSGYTLNEQSLFVKQETRPSSRA